MRALLIIGSTSLAFFAGGTPAFSAESAAPKPTQATAPGPEGAQHVQTQINLSDGDRDAVKKVVLGASTQQPTPDKFEASVGASVPGNVYVHAMPQDVTRDRPALAQLMYAHLDRSIILIDAVQKKVTAVIPLSESEASTAPKQDEKKADLAAVGGLPQLDEQKKQAIYRAAGNQNAQAVPAGAAMRAGVDAPASLTLAPIPQDVAAQMPEFAGKHFAVLQDGRLLIVDPANRKVTGIITKDEGTQTAQGGSTRDGIQAHEDKGGPTAYTSPNNMGQTNSSGTTGQADGNKK